MTVQEFLIDANKRYVVKMRILSNMFKIGYQDTEVLECRMRLADIYLTVLSRLVGDYALTDDEIQAIIDHLIILLEMQEVFAPTVDDFRAITTITEIIINTVYITQPTVRLKFDYDVDTQPSGVTGVAYSSEGTSTVVTVTHNIGVANATIEVVNTSGDRVYPGINYYNSNICKLYFNSSSTSVGTITISE